jgi:hypothetical protein
VLYLVGLIQCDYFFLRFYSTRMTRMLRIYTDLILPSSYSLTVLQSYSIITLSPCE